MASGNIIGVHVLAEFPCPRCDGPSIALSLAGTMQGYITEPHEGGGANMDTETMAPASDARGEGEKR